jgi:hypothetical protein
MMPRTKKVLLITGFILLVLALGFALYYVFFRPSVTTGPKTALEQWVGRLPLANKGAPTPSPAQEGTALPTSGQSRNQIPSLPAPLPQAPIQRTTILKENASRNISVQPGANAVRIFNTDDGKFYRVFGDGSLVAMSDKTFNGVETVNWGHSTDKAILTFPDGSNIVYDFQNDKATTLPQHWEDFDFSPQDNQIVAKSIGINASNRFLVIANSDGTDPKPIEELGSNQDKVHSRWSPNNQIVAYSFTGDALGFDRQAVLLLGKNQENFKSLIVAGWGLIPEWSPSGNQLLYSVWTEKNGYRPSLWISGANGDNINAGRRSLSIQTWADKCVWKNETMIYCAVPSNMGDGAGLQRTLFDTGLDYIYRIDLSTGLAQNVGQPDGIISVKQITISADGNSLFLTDNQSGKLARFDVN